jgi:hypothetical protein
MESNINLQKGLSANHFFQIGIILITFLLITLAIGLTSPPRPKDLETPNNEFSAARAFNHIEAISQQPHMIGTEANLKVAEYLKNELIRIGLEVDIQKTTALNFEDVPIYGNITNVMGRLKGTENTKAVMVLGHYDSQPYSFGAADDGIALASILESAEILKNHYSVKNDIIFLFTDAEEVGLLGAIAFANEHPWIDDVGLVLNIEARGTRGAALSFEVSSENGWIIKEFMRHVDRPYAGSMMYEVYKMMPNYTDFTIFKNKGISGFNVAIVEGYENYHSPTDRKENLSLASLQHMGSYIMSIALHFGNISLEQTKANDLVYFNILGPKMVYYPMSWNTILFIVIILLFALLMFLGFSRGKLNLLKILYSFLLCIAALALAVIAVMYLNKLIKVMYPHYNVFYSSNFYNAQYYYYAYKALTVAVSTFIFYLLLRKINIFNAVSAVFLLFIIISIVILMLIPTASYLTFVPLVFGLIAFNLILWFDISPDKKSLFYYLLLFVAAVPFIFVLSPYIYLIFHIFGLSLPIAGAGMLMLLMLIMLPLLEGALKRFKLIIPAAALAFSILFLFIAHAKSGYSEKQPLQSNVMYASLLDEEKAYWLSSFTNTDEWNKQFFKNPIKDSIPDIYPARKKIYLKNEADFMTFARPEVTVISDSTTDNVRYLEFNIKSLIESGGFELLIPNSFNLRNFAINGKQAYDLEKLAKRKGGYIFRCLNPGENGMNVSIDYTGDQQLEFSVIEKRMGLPPFSFIEPMPASIIKGVGYESHITLVKSNMKL